MTWSVFLTDDAARDLSDIYANIARHDSPGKADHVLQNIEKILDSLSESPERGAFPKELLGLGIRDFRELFFKPYRMIYRIIEKHVYVLVIADGRRDMATLLERRLLQG